MLGGWRGNVGLMESNAQPNAGLMALVTCGLTAEDRDQLRNTELILSTGRPYLY